MMTAVYIAMVAAAIGCGAWYYDSNYCSTQTEEDMLWGIIGLAGTCVAIVSGLVAVAWWGISHIHIS